MTPTTDRDSQRTIPQALTYRELRSHPTVRDYMLIGLAALFVVVVCLADRGLGWWSLVPALVGGAILLAHGSSGPSLMLLSLTGLILADTRYPGHYSYGYRQHEKIPELMDLILCVAVLTYIAAAYRLLALTRRVFPPDPRRQPSSGFNDPARRRSADQVTVREMVLLLPSLAVWTSLSVVVWSWIMDDVAPWNMPQEVWRVLRLVWVGLALAATVGIAAGYLRRTLATPQESLLYLQDQFWIHTRREQGRLYRWLARSRPPTQDERKRS